MSRCFPYPRPYCDEFLIESIKLQKGREKPKEEKKKEKKREKASRKPRHKEKNRKKRKHEETSLLDQKGQYSQKTSDDVIEQLESSGLTEEHELSHSIQYKHDSPESSQDSSKRRKLVPSSSSYNQHGTVLRIKLPSLRQRDLEPQLPPLQQIDSELLSRQRDSDPLSIQMVGQDKVLPVAKLKQKVHELPAADEQPCFSGRDAETTLDQETAVPSRGSSSSRRNRSRTSEKEQLGDLVVNWNLLPLQYESPDIGDEEWLFRSSSCTNECKGSTIGSGCGDCAISSLLQPRACYLPEFDVYQLPFVIPF